MSVLHNDAEADENDCPIRFGPTRERVPLLLPLLAAICEFGAAGPLRVCAMMMMVVVLLRRRRRTCVAHSHLNT